MDYQYLLINTIEVVDEAFSKKWEHWRRIIN